MMSQGIEGFRQDLKDWIRARPSILYAGFLETNRAIEEIRRIADDTGAEVMVYRLGSTRLEGIGRSESMDPFQVLDEILRTCQTPGKRTHRLWVLLYFHLLVEEPNGILLAKLREIVDQGSMNETVLLVGPSSFRLPEELSDIPFLDAPPPGVEEIRNWLNPKDAEEDKRRIERACLGLSFGEVEDLFSFAVARHGFIEPECVEKKSLQKRGQRAAGILRIEYPETTLEDIGGYQVLKDWLKVRKQVFLKRGALGIAHPKGILLLGVPGCGKSFISQAVAGSWEIPLVRMDPSCLYSSPLGASEQNLRRALNLVESASPCVLWIDELEKGFAVTDPRTDGGVGYRLLGTLLSFLQERSSPVFIVGTTNDIRMLPKEFLRKGRWDEIFFLDLPEEEERRSILEKILARHGIDVPVTQPMVGFSENFSGAELEQAVLDAIFQSGGRRENVGDWEIFRALRKTIPLSYAFSDEIEALRSWARFHARLASKSPESSITSENGSLHIKSTTV